MVEFGSNPKRIGSTKGRTPMKSHSRPTQVSCSSTVLQEVTTNRQEHYGNREMENVTHGSHAGSRLGSTISHHQRCNRETDASKPSEVKTRIRRRGLKSPQIRTSLSCQQISCGRARREPCSRGNSLHPQNHPRIRQRSDGAFQDVA